MKMMKITSTILAFPVALLFASTGAAQTASHSNPTAAEQTHASRAADTLHGHVEKAEKIVNSLLRERQAGSIGQPKNTLIAVHRSDLTKLQAELQSMSSNTPASESANATARATLADHVREAKRLMTLIDRSSSSSNAGQQPVGTTGTRTTGEHNAQPSAPSVAGQENAGRHDIMTIDRTRVKELKQEIEAIERLEAKS